ncbi:hypothetical protein [uncultured Shewanella sp.]|uniref:hypothetical protein n=1 Tax=uncultured Shewanella sp. TaxID=173975 RepID=UPI002636656B|nr:hypothetical protein [uncultured Shewanella sp.]
MHYCIKITALCLSFIISLSSLSYAAQTCPNPPDLPILNPQCLPVEALTSGELTECKKENSSISCQEIVDRFAWQLFIALNWPATSNGNPNSSAYFGEEGDTSPVIWETYKNVEDVFTQAVPSTWATKNKEKVLEATSATVHLTEILQVDRNWLTDQSGNLVYYELRINEDEFDYIMDNTLYSQAGIYNAFTGIDPKGINLPSGEEPNTVGAIEIKAAWRIVPTDKEAYFKKRYKTSKALVGPNDDPHLVALVGLHIIKKTPNLPQWTWSTFEHIDNAPDVGSTAETAISYNFFSHNVAKQDAKAKSVSDIYKPNYLSPPDKYATPPTPMTAPVQMLRIDSIDTVDPHAAGITNTALNLIKAKYPDSVWLNYQLISSQWPTEPQTLTFSAQGSPLPAGTPAPEFLGNLTMESYFQEKKSGGGAGLTDGGGMESGFTADNFNKSSCIGCHRLSATTPQFVDHPDAFWYTDYSSVFFKAQKHASTATHKKAMSPVK